MDETAILKILGELGLVGYFIWRDSRREDVLGNKLTESERGRVDDLKTVVQNNTAALNNQNAAFQELTNEIRVVRGTHREPPVTKQSA